MHVVARGGFFARREIGTVPIPTKITDLGSCRSAHSPTARGRLLLHRRCPVAAASIPRVPVARLVVLRAASSPPVSPQTPASLPRRHYVSGVGSTSGSVAAAGVSELCCDRDRSRHRRPRPPQRIPSALSRSSRECLPGRRRRQERHSSSRERLRERETDSASRGCQPGAPTNRTALLS